MNQKIMDKLKKKNNEVVKKKKRVTKKNIDKTEIYIKKAKEIHGDKFDYSLCKNLKKRDIKVDIICHIHGKFTQSLHKHISGDGCRKCGREITSIKNSTDKEELIKNFNICKNYHIGINNGDYYKYKDLNNDIDSKSIIEYFCKKHNTNCTQNIKQHINGHTNCEECKKYRISVKKRKNYQKKFINECIKIYGSEKFNYDNCVYTDSKTLVKNIKCLKHQHYFSQKPKQHRNKKIGCEFCLKEKDKENKNIKLREKKNKIIKLIKEKNSKNKNYITSNNFIYENEYSKLDIHCIEHKLNYKQSIRSWKNRSIGCKECIKKKRVSKINKNTKYKYKEIEDKIKIKKINNIDLSNIKIVREGKRSYVENMLCTKHHYKFRKRLEDYEKGCSKCSYELNIKRLTDITRMTKKELQEKSDKLYGNNYEIIGDYYNARTKIKIHCVKHNHTFEQVPHSL